MPDNAVLASTLHDHRKIMYKSRTADALQDDMQGRRGYVEAHAGDGPLHDVRTVTGQILIASAPPALILDPRKPQQLLATHMGSTLIIAGWPENLKRTSISKANLPSSNRQTPPPTHLRSPFVKTVSAPGKESPAVICLASAPDCPPSALDMWIEEERMQPQGDAGQITMTSSFHGALDVPAKTRSICVEVAVGDAH